MSGPFEFVISKSHPDYDGRCVLSGTVQSSSEYCPLLCVYLLAQSWFGWESVAEQAGKSDSSRVILILAQTQTHTHRFISQPYHVALGKLPRFSSPPFVHL